MPLKALERHDIDQNDQSISFSTPRRQVGCDADVLPNPSDVTRGKLVEQLAIWGKKVGGEIDPG